MINVDLRVSLTTAQKNAWTLIRPILKSYLSKIFKLYRASSDEQRLALRAHNPILDTVLDMLGE